MNTVCQYNIIRTLDHFHAEFSDTGLGFFQNSFRYLIIAFKHPWKHLLTVQQDLLKLKLITHFFKCVLKYTKNCKHFLERHIFSTN